LDFKELKNMLYEIVRTKRDFIEITKNDKTQLQKQFLKCHVRSCKYHYENNPIRPKRKSLRIRFDNMLKQLN